MPARHDAAAIDAAGNFQSTTTARTSMQSIKYLGRSVLAILMVVVAGCAAAPSGAKYNATAKPAEGRALIYVYRPNMMYGKLITFPVLMNHQKVADVGNSAFFKVPVAPGSYTFVTDTQGIDDPITVDVKAGDIKFIRMAVRKNDPMGFVQSLYFTEELRQLAEAELPNMSEEVERYVGPRE
jgi:hypothetical protein